MGPRLAVAVAHPPNCPITWPQPCRLQFNGSGGMQAFTRSNSSCYQSNIKHVSSFGIFIYSYLFSLYTEQQNREPWLKNTHLSMCCTILHNKLTITKDSIFSDSSQQQLWALCVKHVEHFILYMLCDFCANGAYIIHKLLQKMSTMIMVIVLFVVCYVTCPGHGCGPTYVFPR